MVKENSEIVMFNSDEAAQHRTNLSGWVSRNGRYWGDDERAARYDGCTHRLCEDCGAPTAKSWLVCDKCRDIRAEARYNRLLKEEWNEVGMLYSESHDRYFADWEQIEEYCYEEGIKIGTMRLIICEPQYLPLISDDYGCDELAEDGELPDDVIQAVEDFNKVIKASGLVSWIPGKKAALIPTGVTGEAVK